MMGKDDVRMRRRDDGGGAIFLSSKSAPSLSKSASIAMASLSTLGHSWYMSEM